MTETQVTTWLRRSAIVGIVGLLFQTLLTSRLLVVFGLGGTILALPLVLTLGTAILIPTLTMWAAVIRVLPCNCDASGALGFWTPLLSL